MKKLLTILLLITFLISPSLAATVDPITAFEAIISLPVDMRGGHTYQSEYLITSTYNTSIFLNFTLSHSDEINYGEWNVEFILNGTHMIHNESAPGNFTTNLTAISTGDHFLNLFVSPSANIVPGSYSHAISIFSTPIEVSSTKNKKSSGDIFTAWPITTPTSTETAIVTSTPVPTVIPDVVVPTVSPTPAPVNITASQTYSTTDYRPHMVLGGMIFLLAAIISLIVLGRRKRKAIELGTLKK